MAKIGYLKLPYAIEEEERYRATCAINKIIAQCFAESVNDFIQSGVISKVQDKIPIVVKEKILLQKSKYAKVLYGDSTLEESGCAVFCIEQILHSRNININISIAAAEIAGKGYYVLKKGTRHCLFDHLGLKRISCVYEIFDFLVMGKPITALVKNSKYYLEDNKDLEDNKEGSHFVNIVGKEGNDFVIDDPSVGRTNVSIEQMLEAIRIVWVW